MRSIREFWCVALMFALAACDTKPPNDGAATSEGSDSGGDEVSGSTGDPFAEACDLGPGWLSDDALRQSCSEWLVEYCAARPLDECATSFTTSDNFTLGCAPGSVTTMSNLQCGPSEDQCLAVIESELYLCNSCGEEANVQVRETGEGTWSVARVDQDPDTCGSKVFVDGYQICPYDPDACACACA